MDHPEPPSPLAPAEAPFELERLRRSVRARLFGPQGDPVRIGRFVVMDCIGRGGMGVVYSARDEELGRVVAIKLLRPELESSGDGLAKEARALALLSHPNVVSVFDVGEHDGQRFIAMEFVRGRTLREWMGQRRTIPEILAVFAAAGRGLAAAHRVGLVHRDFKPENVLVGDDGRPRVLDFGLARPPNEAMQGPPALPENTDPLATSLTGDGSLLGTPAYMSPEQHLGETAHAASDQFSFAVALWEALHGVRPFAGEDLRTLSLAIVRGRLERGETHLPLPRGLEALLERALRVDPQARFPQLDGLIDAIEDAAELRDVADEAGLEGALERPPDGAALPTPPPPELHRGMRTSVHASRRLPFRPDAETRSLMVRELERLEAKRGRADDLGPGLAWNAGGLSMRLDSATDGSSLLLWRRFSIRAWLRSIAGTVGGGILGMIAVPITAEALGLLPSHNDEFIVPFIFIFAYLGARTAMKVIRPSHARDANRIEGRLDFLADRLVTVATSAALPVPDHEARALNAQSEDEDLVL